MNKHLKRLLVGSGFLSIVFFTFVGFIHLAVRFKIIQVVTVSSVFLGFSYVIGEVYLEYKRL